MGLGVLLALGLVACAPRRSPGLSFSTWGSLDEIETLKPLIKEFEAANPDVPITLIHVPDEYPHKIRLMAAARQIPDVLFMESQTLAGFARRGVLRDLGPYLAADPELCRGDFYRPCLDALTVGGTLYAIPRDLSNLVIFYNQGLFDAAKVPYPATGWSHADMLEKARRLTPPPSPGRLRERWGIGFAPYPIYWLPYLWSEGVDVMDPAMSRSTLLDPPTLAALKRYRDLRWVHHVAPLESEVGNARMSQLFAQGKLAMMVGGRWVVPGFRKKLDFSWDVAPFPRGKAGSVVDADASGWAVATACPHPETAWKLVRFLAGRKAIAAFTRSGLIVPSRPDVATSPAFLGGGPPKNSRVFLDAIASARPTLSPPSYDEIVWELIDGLGPAWNGEQDLEAALRPIAKRIDGLLIEDRR